eukprot:5934805-Pleurochrysis_carterae.AAC.1
MPAAAASKSSTLRTASPRSELGPRPLPDAQETEVVPNLLETEALPTFQETEVVPDLQETEVVPAAPETEVVPDTEEANAESPDGSADFDDPAGADGNVARNDVNPAEPDVILGASPARSASKTDERAGERRASPAESGAASRFGASQSQSQAPRPKATHGRKRPRATRIVESDDESD